MQIAARSSAIRDRTRFSYESKQPKLAIRCDNNHYLILGFALLVEAHILNDNGYTY
jgi:hypothetical protein